jgi:hypothetical protein
MSVERFVVFKPSAVSVFRISLYDQEDLHRINSGSQSLDLADYDLRRWAAGLMAQGFQEHDA